MMLKNSLWNPEKRPDRHPSPDFLAQMRENGKRRMLLFALLSFVMLLCYPLVTALTLSRYSRAAVSLMTLQSVGHSILGICGGPTVLLVTVGGVICAVEGFSWLHSRKKTDMYISQPITAYRRFAITYINGILLYFVPYLVSLLLTLLILSGAGAATGALFMEVLFTFVAAFVYFLAVYNMTLIAVMLSGRKGMAAFFILMGFLYDIILRATLDSYSSRYFSTYVARNDERQYLSPIVRMIELLDKSSFSWGMKQTVITAGDIAEKMILPMLPGLGILLLEAVIFGVIAGYCYKKRPMEAASQAVAFPAVKGPVKALLMVLSGLLGSACFCSVADNDGFWVAFSGLLLGVLLSQALSEIVYESDLRAFARHKKSFAAGAAAALFTYLFFALDIGGYDTWIPKREQVESAAIDIYFENRYRFEYVDDTGAVRPDRRYGLETMEMTDVSGVLSLARDGMGKDAGEKNSDTALVCTVKYKLKNGKEKYRSFRIDYEQEKTVLDILFANEEYKKGTQQVLSAQMDDIFEKSRIYYNNGLQETEIVDKSALPLIRAYQADVLKMSFSDVKDTAPCGELLLRYKTEKGEECTLEYPVFPSYGKTVEYLRGKSIELYLTIPPAAVESIRFFVYEREEDRVMEENGFFGGVMSTQMSSTAERTYEERTQIEELLGCLYPSNLAAWGYTKGAFDEDITVTIESADSSQAYPYHWTDTDFMVKTGEFPDFVKEDIGRE